MDERLCDPNFFYLIDPIRSKNIFIDGLAYHNKHLQIKFSLYLKTDYKEEQD